MHWLAAALLGGAIAAQAQTGVLATKMKQLAFAAEVAAARDLAESQRGRLGENDPELLEALSWVARAGVIAKDWDMAERYGREAYEAASKLAVERGVDSSPQLATALGASIEVLGQVYAAAGDRAAAAQFLHDERAKYRGASIETRIQKNYLLISIEGKPMPPVAAERFIGEPLPIDTEGKVALFYFWAHWCSDCKKQKPALLELHDRYAGRGLVIIGPTHLFGYAENGKFVGPEEEIAYIEGRWQERYPLPRWMPKPLGQENWANFGVSTTPTLVLVDRAGMVRLYRPGMMSLDELDAAIQPLL